MAATEAEKERARRWRERHPDYAIKRAYGVDGAEYDRLLANQGGVCAVCSRPPAKRRLCVDHCHETGRIRGLLCNRCNVAIGHLGDSAEALQRVVTYLEAR